ncbi:DUF3262 family protein [Conservatibacter flavescens]|uniref:DUF3262 domain-containing protein n=1 Tax=Conservatibacter flavescens TaxID=28161 RepID=A0A2M8S124_9PAST|nr:DUF3262 family protein [Conservatibacter flavescens]PJG84804.1 hypothetical protein CVP05_09715 [Conservatibacter flavescens]
MANDYTPVDAFQAASGINATELRTFLAICFIAALFFAYVWAIKKGFDGFHVDGDIFGYLKLVLKGAAIIIVVVIFFTY